MLDYNRGKREEKDGSSSFELLKELKENPKNIQNNI